MRFNIEKLIDRVEIELYFDSTGESNTFLNKLSGKGITVKYNKPWMGPGGMISIRDKRDYDILIREAYKNSELNLGQIEDNLILKLNELYPTQPIKNEPKKHYINNHRELNDKIRSGGRLLKSSEDIEYIVNRVLASRIDREYKEILQGEELVLVSILKGSFMFASDLMRTLTTPVRLGFLGVSSYEDKMIAAHNVKLTSEISINVSNKHVLVLEDIFDTGVTWSYISDYLIARNVKSYRLCALTSKAKYIPFNKEELNPYFGFYCDEDDFLVGYGMDYKGIGRGLKDIHLIKKEPWEWVLH